MHTLGHLEIDKPPQLALWRGASTTAPNVVLGRAVSDPSTTARLNPVSLGSTIDQPQQKVSISGATAFRPPRHQPLLAPRPTLLSCGRAAAMCSIELVCCAPSSWGYDAGCVDLCSKNKNCRRRCEMKAVHVRRVLLFDI